MNLIAIGQGGPAMLKIKTFHVREQYPMKAVTDSVNAFLATLPEPLDGKSPQAEFQTHATMNQHKNIVLDVVAIIRYYA
jgi:hypothetical protein